MISRDQVDMSHNDKYINQITGRIKTKNKIIFTAGTGLGKSYVGKKVIEKSFNNSNVLIVSPTTDLINQWKKHFIDMPNVKFCTYQKIKSLYKLKDLIHYDLMILDEAHHLGADVWGGLSFKLANSMGSKIVGLTATPLRHSDGKNVIELFDEHIEGIDTPEAIERELLPKFIYVSCWYDIKGIINRIQRDIDSGLLSKTYEKKLNLIKNIPSIETVIKDNMPKGQRKILVFYSSYKELKNSQETMRKIYPKASEWIVSYKYSDVQNKKYVKEFEESKNKICILYSVNKFNEGIHLDCVNTAIMFRKTKSYRIFIQEAGRILSLSTAKEKDRILFDFVGNRYNIDVANDSQARYLDNILKLEKEFETHRDEMYSIATIPKDYMEDPIKVLKEIRDMIYLDKKAISAFCKKHGVHEHDFVRVMKRYHYPPKKVMQYYLGEIPNPKGSYYHSTKEENSKRKKEFCEEHGIDVQSLYSFMSRTGYDEEKTFQYFRGEIPSPNGRYYSNMKRDDAETVKKMKAFCKEHGISICTFRGFKYSSGYDLEKCFKFYKGEIPGPGGKYHRSEKAILLDDDTKEKIKRFCESNGIGYKAFLFYMRTKEPDIEKCFQYYLEKCRNDEELELIRKFKIAHNIPTSTFSKFRKKSGYTLEECFKYFLGEIPNPDGNYYKPQSKNRKKK